MIDAKEFEEVLKKATKYDNLKARYIDHGNKLKKIILMCQELLKDIDPSLSPNFMGTRNKSELNYEALANEIYDKMLHGDEIDSDKLQKIYNIPQQKAFYIMQKIKKEHGSKIETRKEGTRAFYYVQKDI